MRRGSSHKGTGRMVRSPLLVEETILVACFDGKTIADLLVRGRTAGEKKTFVFEPQDTAAEVAP
jgi:hypothetical protein